jgi:threonine aldolase
MRQAGIIAAAGLVALSDGPDGMVERLADDHANARSFAEGLAEMDAITALDPADVTTNWIGFGLRPRTGQDALDACEAFVAEAGSRGLGCIHFPRGRVRVLTHYGIERSDIDRALAITRDALKATGLSAIAV